MSRAPWMGLAKMCEESAELIQVAAKLAACPQGIYFDGTDLIEWLENEMADVMAIIQFVEENNDIVVDPKRVEEKYRLFTQWYKGMTTGLSVDTKQDCPDCHGTCISPGSFSGKCDTCHGSGKVDVCSRCGFFDCACLGGAKVVPRESLEDWLRRILSDGNVWAFSLVHILNGVGHIELKVQETRYKDEKDLSKLFLSAAEKYAEALPGIVTFNVLAYIAPDQPPVDRKIFVLKGGLRGQSKVERLPSAEVPRAE